LRRKQRAELEASLAVSRSVAREEANIAVKATQDAASRAVKVAQAEEPGEESTTNLDIQTRLQAAAQVYQQEKESREEAQKAAYEEYNQTGDRLALEKSAGDIRKSQLESEYNLQKAILDLRTEKEIHIAQIQNEQAQHLADLLGSLYDDLGKHGAGPKVFFQHMLDDFKKQLFVNTGSIVFDGVLPALGGVIPGQQQIDPTTGQPTDKLTTLGQILKGTPLGVDPAKLAQAQEIKAVDRNTKALDDLTAALTGSQRGAPANPGGTSGNSTYGNNPGAWGGWSGGGRAASPAGGGIGALGGIFGDILGGIGKVINVGNGGGYSGTNSGGVPFQNFDAISDANGGISLPDLSNLPIGGPNFPSPDLSGIGNGASLPGATWPGTNIPLPSGGSGGVGPIGSIPNIGPLGGGSGGVNTNNPMTAVSSLASLASLIPLIKSNGNSAVKGTLQTAALQKVFKNIPSLTGAGGIFGPQYDANGDPTFSAGQTGLASALALPQIIGGFEQGGVGGDLTAAGGILGAASSIPGPQQPFLMAGSAILTLLGPLLGQTRYQQWVKNMNNRLASKFQTPSSINLTEDLAGNSADFDYLGNLRTYSGYPATNLSAPAGHTVNVNTMDARSFMDNSDMIAHAVRNQVLLGHPLASTIQNLVRA